MSILIIRHELSEANNRNNYGTPAFDNPESPLMPEARLRAANLGSKLLIEYGINPAEEPAAVSQMLRTRETAELAGFKTITAYPELNEEKGRLNKLGLRIALEQKVLPSATRKAAKYLLEHPPAEKVWITHGLLIAGLCEELGVYRDARFIPSFGEVRAVEI